MAKSFRPDPNNPICTWQLPTGVKVEYEESSVKFYVPENFSVIVEFTNNAWQIYTYNFTSYYNMSLALAIELQKCLKAAIDSITNGELSKYLEDRAEEPPTIIEEPVQYQMVNNPTVYYDFIGQTYTNTDFARVIAKAEANRAEILRLQKRVDETTTTWIPVDLGDDWVVFRPEPLVETPDADVERVPVDKRQQAMLGFIHD